MQFNSYGFIFAFLPMVILSYFLLGKIKFVLGKIVIIAASLFFYAYSGISNLKVLGISIAINYIFAILIGKVKWKKIFMYLPVMVNVCLLLYFKYSYFAIAHINEWFGKELLQLKWLCLPLGISFFTFQQIAYIVAVYNHEIKKVDFVDYISYILYFPKILMGPLMDPADFIEQYNDRDLMKVNWGNIASGLKLFSFGLVKKVILADTFSKAVSWGFANVEEATSMDWILVMLFYTFEIYFDFSGYSDMAVGVSQMINISLPINFDSPYKALSVRDFWKRWHISLTKFLTKYIYIPLGGSKKGILFTCVNTMIVFLISGMWHGAIWTFVVWGILHGAFCVFDRLVEKYAKNIFEPARWLLSFIVINILWLLFRSESIQQWSDILLHIISMQSTYISDGLIASFSFPEAEFFLNTILFWGKNAEIRGFIMNMFILVSAFVCFILENNYRNKDKFTWAGMIFASVFFVWGITCLSSESVFLYFNF